MISKQDQLQRTTLKSQPRLALAKQHRRWRMRILDAQVYWNKMASLLPIIQDILPMILTGSVEVTKSSDIIPAETETTGIEETAGVRVISRNAMVDKTDKMCASSQYIETICLILTWR